MLEPTFQYWMGDMRALFSDGKLRRQEDEY